MTPEENARLTRVGPDTPGGRMLRRYWWPIGVSEHVRDRATLIRLLGEDLVLYRDKTGTLGLLGAKCSHRRANLCFGTVEEDGLRCRYHGWKYGSDGTILDMPGVAHGDQIVQQLRHPSYRVAEHAGVILAYMGPEPAPLIPQFDVLVGEGERIVEVTGVSEANWLQCVENAMDPTHVAFLHGDVAADLGVKPDRVECIGTEYGLFHATYRKGPREGTVFYREHHLALPGISVTGAGQRRMIGGSGPSAVSARWTVPMDDETSLMTNIFYKPAENTGRINPDAGAGGFGAWEAVKAVPYGEYRSGEFNGLGYVMPKVVPSQDATVLDSMGPICDRENENLVPGDEAIVRLRRLFSEAIDDVEAGRDPIGVFRTPTLVPILAHERIIDEREPERVQ